MSAIVKTVARTPGAMGAGRPLLMLACAVAALLLVSAVMASTTLQAHAAEGQAELCLARGMQSVNQPFDVTNMLPGDSESIATRVEVLHDVPLTVWFKAELTSDTSTLSNQIILHIADANGHQIWRGSIADLDANGAVGIPLQAPANGQSFLDWTITASLDTGVGNEFQAQKCTVDLHWWVDSADSGALTPVKTGDATLWWVLLAVVALFAAAYVLQMQRKRALAGEGAVLEPAATAQSMGASDMPKHASADYVSADRRKKMLASAGIILGCLVLAGTAWALLQTRDTLPDNRFVTGTVDIEIEWDAQTPGVNPNESSLVEPGFTLLRSFTVYNRGTADFYYEIYFDTLKGPLAPALEAVLTDDDGTVVYRGPATAMAMADGCPVEEPLAVGESRTFTLQVHMMEGAGNGYQGKTAECSVSARATQVKNNEGRAF